MATSTVLLRCDAISHMPTEDHTTHGSTDDSHLRLLHHCRDFFPTAIICQPTVTLVIL